MRFYLYEAYSLWRRDMLSFSRQKDRLIGYSFAPLFLLAFIGLGFKNQIYFPEMKNIDYLSFLTPGMVAMTLLTASNSTSFLMLWDREMGFLKEIMVTPSSRIGIILGRTASGVTVAIFQSFIILFGGIVMGSRFHRPEGMLISLIFMALIASAFIGLGLSLASFKKETYGFSLVLNFILYPFLFLSGALYPVDRLPSLVAPLAYYNPLTYGIDGLRYSLLGVSSFSPALDLGVMAASCLAMLGLGTYLFEKGEWD